MTRAPTQETKREVASHPGALSASSARGRTRSCAAVAKSTDTPRREGRRRRASFSGAVTSPAREIENARGSKAGNGVVAMARDGSRPGRARPRRSAPPPRGARAPGQTALRAHERATRERGSLTNGSLRVPRPRSEAGGAFARGRGREPALRSSLHGLAPCVGTAAAVTAKMLLVPPRGRSAGLGAGGVVPSTLVVGGGNVLATAFRAWADRVVRG